MPQVKLVFPGRTADGLRAIAPIACHDSPGPTGSTMPSPSFTLSISPAQEALVFCSAEHTRLQHHLSRAAPQLSWRLCSRGPGSLPTHCPLPVHSGAVSPPSAPCCTPITAAAQGPGDILFLCAPGAPGRQRCMNDSGAPRQGACRKWGAPVGRGGRGWWRLPTTRTGPKSRGFCAPAPQQGGEEAGGPSSCQRQWGGHSWGGGVGGNARPVTMATVAPGKPEVGAVEGPLLHADAAWREEASWAACPPTRLCHSISVFTKAEQYPRAR